MGRYIDPVGLLSPGSKESVTVLPYLGPTLLIPHCPVWHRCYGSLAAAIGCTWAGSQRIKLSWVTRT